MDQILNNLSIFFSNVWVVGIVGGIPSGLAVAWLSKYIFRETDSKEYLQKVQSANLEVIYSLRPLITESAFPSSEVLDSLISATARKYKVERKSMNSAGQFVDELIKEVMDSSFIPHKKKSELCTHLVHIKNEETAARMPESFTLDARIAYRDKVLNIMSLTLGLMVSISVILVSIGGKLGTTIVTYPFPPSTINFILPIFASLVALIITFFATYLLNNDPDTKNFLTDLRRSIRKFLP